MERYKRGNAKPHFGEIFVHRVLGLETVEKESNLDPVLTGNRFTLYVAVGNTNSDKDVKCGDYVHLKNAERTVNYQKKWSPRKIFISDKHHYHST
jgi:hypothetical protein